MLQEDKQTGSSEILQDDIKYEPIQEKYVRRHHTPDQIIGAKDLGVMTRNNLKNDTCLMCKVEPRSIKDDLGNEDWIKAMNEEIDQIEKNKTLTLVPKPKDKDVIGTKWAFRNKLNEKDEVIRNKERLVCKGYGQEEGIDYGETFSLVARLEGVRNFLAYATYKGFKVFQMDVKYAFLNGILEEEFWIKQPE